MPALGALGDQEPLGTGPFLQGLTEGERTARIAINGLGRIGRAAFKIVRESPRLELVAVNDLFSASDLAYLLNYDSVYGRYPARVEHEPGSLVVEGTRYPVFNLREPLDLPWRRLGVDIVLECTGVFTRAKDLEGHLAAGARYVLLSAPAKDEAVPTVVHRVNAPEGSIRMYSCASCTTNCITPVVEVLGRRIGIRKAIMTTVHAYTAGQSLVDAPHKNRRRGRAASLSFVPTSTGAAAATTRALPQYAGKFDGVAIRGPVPAGSIADLVFVTERATSVEEVNAIFLEEASSERYAGVLGVTEDPIVSSDIIQDPRAAVVDLSLTQVVDGDLLKVLAWYDNEWGYTNQLVREAVRIAMEIDGQR